MCSTLFIQHQMLLDPTRLPHSNYKLVLTRGDITPYEGAASWSSAVAAHAARGMGFPFLAGAEVARVVDLPLGFVALGVGTTWLAFVLAVHLVVGLGGSPVPASNPVLPGSGSRGRTLPEAPLLGLGQDRAAVVTLGFDERLRMPMNNYGYRLTLRKTTLGGSSSAARSLPSLEKHVFCVSAPTSTEKCSPVAMGFELAKFRVSDNGGVFWVTGNEIGALTYLGNI